LDEVLIETAEIYLRVAQNSIRYIGEANERNEFLSDDEYEESDRLINRALGRARSLIDLELSWRHSVLFYDILGVYLTEKGRYEERRGNLMQAEKLYKTASRVHEMTRLHLIDGSDEGKEVAEGRDKISQSEWYNNVDSLIYLRNLIDLGRTRQHLYRQQYTNPYKGQTNLGLEKRSKEFQAARRILLQALKISTKTDNFICRAEAHLALADLYVIDKENWGSAIIAYRCCIETFNRDEYIAYHDKVCDKLADFYADNHAEFDKTQKAVFIKSLNLCADFENQNMCKHYQRKGNLRQHLGELIKRAPDECPEIACGRCSPHYWSDI
jgi:tetratricopeptide (TPR) repeat protein